MVTKSVPSPQVVLVSWVGMNPLVVNLHSYLKFVCAKRFWESYIIMLWREYQFNPVFLKLLKFTVPLCFYNFMQHPYWGFVGYGINPGFGGPHREVGEVVLLFSWSFWKGFMFSSLTDPWVLVRTSSWDGSWENLNCWSGCLRSTGWKLQRKVGWSKLFLSIVF